tara:strand:- start:231 stop:422 length:192 start_codon:yes stop_codon:yes gene_type:complete
MGKVKESILMEKENTSEDEYITKDELEKAMNEGAYNPWIDIEIKESKIETALEDRAIKESRGK